MANSSTGSRLDIGFTIPIGVGRLRILGAGGARFRILGGGGAKVGANSQQAYDVVLTSMRRRYVASTSCAH